MRIKQGHEHHQPKYVGIRWLVLVIGVLGPLAYGEEGVQPDVQLLAEVRVGTRLEPATQLDEGAEIFYTLRIRNPGAKPMAGVSVTQPVPYNTRYVAGSAAGAGADITFSIDGGAHFAHANQLKWPGNPGKVAPASHYTHIRWQMAYPLAARSVVLARFRAVFN